MLRKSIKLLLILSIAFGCRGIEVFETGSKEVWSKRPTDQTINLGHFEVRGFGSAKTAEVLRSSLRFHLLNLGYRVADLSDYTHLLSERKLSLSQPFTHNEILLLSGSLRERFLIQGYLYEYTRFAMPEDRIDLTLSISIYDTRTGQTASEYRLFLSDSSVNPTLNIFRLSQRFAREFHSTDRKYRP